MACGVEHNTVIVGNFQVVIALNWPFSAYLLNPLTCTSINIYGIVSFEHTIHACVCVEVGKWKVNDYIISNFWCYWSFLVLFDLLEIFIKRFICITCSCSQTIEFFNGSNNKVFTYVYHEAFKMYSSYVSSMNS